MNFDPCVKNNRDRESPQSQQNTNDKSVCRPTALPVTKKRTVKGTMTNLFGAATPRPASQPTRGMKMHTNPFDGDRQAAAPRQLVKHVDVHYSAPRNTGLKHVQPVLRADRGFVSAGGAISFGGRRHQQSVASTSATVEHSPEPQPQSPAALPPKAAARRSPISHEPDVLVVQQTPSDAALPSGPKSASRQRSHAPTLVGVMSKEAPKQARPFTLQAPFHISTPPRSPMATQQLNEAKPWDKDQSKILRPGSSQRTSKAPFHTNTPREATRARISNAVRPPWHTDTPR